MGNCSLVEWFANQMPGTMVVVWYTDHHLVNELVFRPPFEYRSAIQMSNTVVSGICIANHLNNDQVKVFRSDVSVFQMSAIQIPTVLVLQKGLLCKTKSFTVQENVRLNESW